MEVGAATPVRRSARLLGGERSRRCGRLRQLAVS
jgi:hypothetical protein